MLAKLDRIQWLQFEDLGLGRHDAIPHSSDLHAPGEGQWLLGVVGGIYHGINSCYIDLDLCFSRWGSL